jgi:hypothetical protein
MNIACFGIQQLGSSTSSRVSLPVPESGDAFLRCTNIGLKSQYSLRCSVSQITVLFCSLISQYRHAICMLDHDTCHPDFFMHPDDPLHHQCRISQCVPLSPGFQTARNTYPTRNPVMSPYRPRYVKSRHASHHARTRGPSRTAIIAVKLSDGKLELVLLVG